MYFNSSVHHADNSISATELVLQNIGTLFYSRHSLTTCCVDKVVVILQGTQEAAHGLILILGEIVGNIIFHLTSELS